MEMVAGAGAAPPPLLGEAAVPSNSSYDLKAVQSNMCHRCPRVIRRVQCIIAFTRLHPLTLSESLHGPCHELLGRKLPEPLLWHLRVMHDDVALLQLAVQLRFSHAHIHRPHFDSPSYPLTTHHYIRRRWLAQERHPVVTSLDRQQAPERMTSRPVVNLSRSASAPGIDGRAYNRQHRAALVPETAAQRRIQFVPRCPTACFLFQHHVVDQPPMLPAAPAPYRDFEAISCTSIPA